MIQLIIVLIGLFLIGFIFGNFKKGFDNLKIVIKNILSVIVILLVVGIFVYTVPILLPPVLQAVKYFIMMVFVDISDISGNIGSEESIHTGLMLLAKLGFLAFLAFLIYLLRRCYKWIFSENIIAK